MYARILRLFLTFGIFSIFSSNTFAIANGELCSSHTQCDNYRSKTGSKCCPDPNNKSQKVCTQKNSRGKCPVTSALPHTKKTSASLGASSTKANGAICTAHSQCEDYRSKTGSKCCPNPNNKSQEQDKGKEERRREEEIKKKIKKKIKKRIKKRIKKEKKKKKKKKKKLLRKQQKKKVLRKQQKLAPAIMQNKDMDDTSKGIAAGMAALTGAMKMGMQAYSGYQKSKSS